MRIVALVTQKGGSGKSTLAASIAVEMQARGETVFLVDMDPQRSLATWARGRSDRRLAGAAVGPERLDDVLATLRARAVTLSVIDTPANLSPATDAAILAADLILVPVRPTAFDLWAAEATWRRVRDLGRDCAFVLNQCPTLQVSRRVRTGIEALDAMGAVLSPPVTARVDYQDAMSRGLGPSEVDPAGEASREIRLLCRAIRRRIDDSCAGRSRGQQSAAVQAGPPR
ncbi:ParA family protein [Lichenibacterium dinghuense]|uniref:ParA family protein n=1 Tax=Lichenibacterium dinghuense TaxID=2895977 RepID=UPI001F3DF6D2|nr:ParA family protein [Lichenibacterium sp. 6Y81]